MDRIHRRLEELRLNCDTQARRQRDPVYFLHQYEEETDREVVGLVAALLAFGHAGAAMRSIDRALRTLGERPSEMVRTVSVADLCTKLDGFVHRIYRAEHLAAVLAGAGRMLREYDTLGTAFASYYQTCGRDFRRALTDFADRLRGEGADPSLRHLVSDPSAGSACKRLLLYMRWMVRAEDGVDLGLWSEISPSVLLIPVDTHVHRISRNLGFTERATANWAAAEEITASLRCYDPADPVKYDFAICHLGVSRQCPSRQDLDKCSTCVLRQVCRVWQSPRDPCSTKERSQSRL